MDALTGGEVETMALAVTRLFCLLSSLALKIQCPVLQKLSQKALAHFLFVAIVSIWSCIR
jgi:hypothetical protein